MATMRTRLHCPVAAAACALGLFTATVSASPFPSVELNHSLLEAPLGVDWQPPWVLPPRFRNHCGYDRNRGRWYCANHCGLDYAFYYCSPASFGCCHRGYGYCDWKGHLRCAP
jgi:hypothetical protein